MSLPATLPAPAPPAPSWAAYQAAIYDDPELAEKHTQALCQGTPEAWQAYHDALAARPAVALLRDAWQAGETARAALAHGRASESGLAANADLLRALSDRIWAHESLASYLEVVAQALTEALATGVLPVGRLAETALKLGVQAGHALVTPALGPLAVDVAEAVLELVDGARAPEPARVRAALSRAGVVRRAVGRRSAALKADYQAARGGERGAR